jgi:hypothetical protein
MEFFQSNDMILQALIIAVVIMAVAFGILTYINFQQDLVAQWLTLAERDLNNLLGGGLAHGGRKERVGERKEWNEMAQTPAIQINTGSYRSVAHELVESNEKELSGKGNTMGKASTTAFLLRELYEGNVDTAQSKIHLDTINNGKPPYIAPGIYELVGFDKFDPVTGFPPGAGVNRLLLFAVVLNRGYPRDVQFIKTDDATGMRTRLTGVRALLELTQQNL